MKYVIDCSACFQCYVAETNTARALRLADDFDNGICELLAPDLLPTEMANAFLWEEQKQNSRIAPGDAELLLAQALQYLPILFSRRK
jgi:predicted nucleic acid-binding protein